jgi:hypothetical protein
MGSVLDPIGSDVGFIDLGDYPYSRLLFYMAHIPMFNNGMRMPNNVSSKKIHLFLLESKNSKEPEPMGEEKASPLEYKSTTNEGLYQQSKRKVRQKFGRRQKNIGFK